MFIQAQRVYTKLRNKTDYYFSLYYLFFKSLLFLSYSPVYVSQYRPECNAEPTSTLLMPLRKHMNVEHVSYTPHKGFSHGGDLRFQQSQDPVLGAHPGQVELSGPFILSAGPQLIS